MDARGKVRNENVCTVYSEWLNVIETIRKGHKST